MGYLRKMQVLFLMVLAGIMILSASAFAESVQFYDSSVITGFERADYETTIDTEYKYAMIELEKEFPSQLTVWLGGEAIYEENPGGSRILTSVSGYVTQTVDVTWICREDYNEKLEVFHFFPNFGEYKLASGLELPEIIVNVLDTLPIPPRNPISEQENHPIVVKDKGLEGNELEGNELEENTALPSSYNGYTKGVLPAIRGQYPYGTCWAHAAIAAIEADLIHDGNATTSIDLSELHLAYFSYHQFTDEKGLNTGDTISGVPSGTDYLNHGGLANRVADTLFNMLGPVKESAAPYSSAASYAPAASTGRNGDYTITGIYYYDILSDRNAVKQAIMDHGAVVIAYYSSQNYYDAINNSFYVPTESGTDHEVTIVGWDDSFSKSKFSSGTPEGNGAWLVRNSWGGSGYSMYSYFWLSYYDKSLDQYAYAYDAKPGRYDHIYAYDNSPAYYWTNASNGLSQSFYVDGGESIQAIGYFTEESDLGLKFTVSAGSNSVTKSFTTGAPGYYLIPLSTPLTVSSRTKVTVSCTITSGYLYAYYENGSTSGSYTFTAATGSDGMIVNGSNIGRDGKVKLFTNKASGGSMSTLSISQGNVLGTNAGITLKTARDNAASGYKITVYDIDAKKTVSPTIKATQSSSTTTIDISGSGMVNGHVYKLTIYKYDSAGNKSNTVTVYGMPSGTISKLTAQPVSLGVKLNSQYMSGMDGVSYYIIDASTGSRVAKETLSGNKTVLNYSGLENAKLYYVYARPYRIYNNKTVLGGKGKPVYFVPVAIPSEVTVQFTDATTAVISTKEKSTPRGIRVLYREVGGSVKNGCLKADNYCSIGNLSQAKNYEFYVMHYNIINNVRHYGSGVAVQYTAPTVSAMSRPADAKIHAGDPTWTFTITKSSDAKGISVLYRINEGNFQQCCEKEGVSCTKDLTKDQLYTFYIMQYKTVNGKKVYSPGITVKNLYGTKSIDGSDLATEFVQSNEIVNTDEFYTVLEDYLTEEDLLEQEAFELLEAEETAEYPDIPENELEEPEEEFDEMPEDFMMASEGFDDFEPTEDDFIDVPVDGTSEDGFELNNPEQKGIATTAEPVGEESAVEESDGIDFYTFGSDTEPYYGAPSFNNK